MYAAICNWINEVWIVVGIVWAIGYLLASRAKRTQSVVSRVAHLAIMIAAFALVFRMPVHEGFLFARFLPPEAAVAWTGFAITLAAAAFAVAARLVLGRNWSGTVTVKYDHTLVREGPYSLVRHPVYTGLVFGLFGTAIAFGRTECLVGVALAVIGCWQKWRIEEQFMTEQFGAQYSEYRQHVKALIPYVW